MTATTSAHRTVSRVTAILEQVAASSDGVRLGPLVTALDAPKSSVYGLVRGLVAEGYLVEEAGAYRLGPAVGLLLTAAGPPLGVVARRAMDSLRDTTGETVLLASRLGNWLVYVAAAESLQDIRFSTALNVRRPLYPTSSGKCFLAFAPRARADRFLASRVAPERLGEARAELDDVARRGVAFNFGETESAVFGAASPILRAGIPVAALAVSGPSTRMADRMDEIGAAVRSAARDVSESLGSDR
jgi:DNA-binding IclR family transcriptional regulator